MSEPVPKIEISSRQRSILERLVGSEKTAHRTFLRARIVLLSEEGLDNSKQGRILGVDRQRVRRWRRRWLEASASLLTVEEKGASDKDLKAKILDVLSDHYRSGTPSKFTAEQMTQLVALACEDPKESDLPISHWTPPDLVREAVKRGIVESISPRHLDRFLKGGGRSPSQDSLLAELQGR